MKIAFYMEDGLEQIVLTPESDFEKKMLGKLHEGGRELSVKRGSFFECRGGYVRHQFGRYNDSGYGGFGGDGDDSTMLVLRILPPAEPPAPQADGDRVSSLGSSET